MPPSHSLAPHQRDALGLRSEWAKATLALRPIVCEGMMRPPWLHTAASLKPPFAHLGRNLRQELGRRPYSRSPFFAWRTETDRAAASFSPMTSM